MVSNSTRDVVFNVERLAHAYIVIWMVKYACTVPLNTMVCCSSILSLASDNFVFPYSNGDRNYCHDRLHDIGRLKD